MTRAGIRTWAIAVVAVLSTAAPSMSEVIYDEPIDTFDIGATDGSVMSVWQAIRRWGPQSHAGHDSSITVGTTTLKNWSWTYKTQQSARGCAVINPQVKVTAQILLPDWLHKAGASYEAQQYWACIEDTVTVHERRHGQIWRETAELIDRAILDVPPGATCESAKAAISTRANMLAAEGKQRQVDFDRTEYKLRRFDRCELLMKPAKSPKAQTGSHGGNASSTASAEAKASASGADIDASAVRQSPDGDQNVATVRRPRINVPAFKAGGLLFLLASGAVTALATYLLLLKLRR